MSPLFQEALALTYRPDLNVLFLRWPQPVYALPAKDVYQQVLALAQETSARFWLFDVRSRGPLSPEDAQWVCETFYPQLHAEGGLAIHISYLFSPSHAEDDATLQLIQKLRTEPWFGQEVELEHFTSETEALLWLKRCQLAEIVK